MDVLGQRLSRGEMAGARLTLWPAGTPSTSRRRAIRTGTESRFIPAGAGNRKKRPAEETPPPVHPRRRGEQSGWNSLIQKGIRDVKERTARLPRFSILRKGHFRASSGRRGTGSGAAIRREPAGWPLPITAAARGELTASGSTDRCEDGAAPSRRYATRGDINPLAGGTRSPLKRLSVQRQATALRSAPRPGRRRRQRCRRPG